MRNDFAVVGGVASIFPQAPVEAGKASEAAPTTKLASNGEADE